MSDATPPPTIPHVGPDLDEHGRRDRFSARELAVALSHYDIDVIESIREFPRGSRRSPKVRIRTRSGEFLFKRRAPGRNEPERVAFAHELQLRLATRGCPVPGLVGTRAHNNSMLLLGSHVYEMFNFVRGRRYDRSPAETAEAGAVLGQLHRDLHGYSPQFAAPRESFHGATGVPGALDVLPDAVRTADPAADRDELARICARLGEAYGQAADHVARTGHDARPAAVLHGDWHPGNLLFRDGVIVGVLDFDSARLEPRVTDVANGLLQFSMRMGRLDDPGAWPVELDLERFQRFLRGYDGSAPASLDGRERQAVPWLIIEALVMEAVIPIAATGTFAGIPAAPFLRMVERKVDWLAPQAGAITDLLEALP